MDLRHNIGVAAATACLMLWGGAVYAQTESGADPVHFIIAPEIPGPGELVSIEAEGVGGFLGNATLTWSVDGKTVKSGAGETFFTFTAGALGKTSQVRVSIQSSQYGTIVRSFSFTPSRVDLLWEADTTVPPWYAGKALYSPGATVRVFAYPEIMQKGVRAAPATLSYRWLLNDVPQLSQSGVGRTSFTFDGSQLHDSETVAVEVFAGTTAAGRGEITIPAATPMLVLYNKDPLRGILYDLALGAQARLGAKEATVRAEPYYFSRESARRGSLVFSWLLNGNDAAGPATAGGELTLRQTGSGEGSADLSVTLQNTEDTKLLQAAETSLTIKFGQSENAFSAFFGL